MVNPNLYMRRSSLPTRERGLKDDIFIQHIIPPIVAPYAGAWIESHLLGPLLHELVSLPTRERGLKAYFGNRACLASQVAPYAGAWIERLNRFLLRNPAGRRSLRGSVD